MNPKSLTWKEFIATKPSLYVNIQDYIKNGQELLKETNFDELEHGDKIKNKIEEFIEKARTLLISGGVD